MQFQFFVRRPHHLIPFCALALFLSIGFQADYAQAQLDESSTINLTEEFMRLQGNDLSVNERSTLDRIRERSTLPPRSEAQFGIGGRIAPEDRLRFIEMAERRRPSRLEVDYSERAGEDLRQFGYELFDRSTEFPETFSGAVQDDYVLGIGDELVITFRGQTNDVVVTRVDREGRIILSTLPPIVAAGREFGDVRQELEARTQLTLLGTEVYVSVGAIRTTTVVVVGEVERPGLKRLPSLATLLDAMNLAGGVKKTGSLRRIQVVRGNQIFWLDLYDLLMNGTLHRSLAIMEGDRIVVPPIGPTVAVAGWVKRAGIYEMPEASNHLNLSDLLDFAGGLVRPWGIRLSHLTPNAQGREQIVESPEIESASVREGDILVAAITDKARLGGVSLVGHVMPPQKRSLAAAPTLRALIGDGTTIKGDAYLSFTAIRTIDQKTRSPQFYPVNLKKVILGEQDFRLESADSVILFGVQDIRFLGSDAVASVLFGDGTVSSTECSGLSVLSRIVGFESSNRFSAARLLLGSRTSGGSVGSEIEERLMSLEERRQQLAELRARMEFNPMETDLHGLSVGNERAIACPEQFQNYPELLPFLLEHSVSMSGEVRMPGIYPIVPGDSLASVIAAAGGFTRQADLSQIEVLSKHASSQGVSGGLLSVADNNFTAVPLKPGEAVKIGSRYSNLDIGPVEILGEVRRPGQYSIRRGEKLSQLIERAGGLTRNAYPIGAFFTRASARESEKVALLRTATELETSLALALTSSSSSTNLGGASAAVATLTETLRNIEPVGRIVIEADPTVLQIRPDLDIVLEPGDQIVMPKRPSNITVSGEVLNPSSLQFASGKAVIDYIRDAGSYNELADKDRIFVLHPNGTAKPISVSFWNYEPVNLLPGSTIIVPRDPSPFNLYTIVKDLASVLSQVAITAASLKVISAD